MKTRVWLFLFCAPLALSCPIPKLGAQEAAPEPVWRHALGGAVIGAPAAQAESVVAVCDGGTVQAYGRSGRQLWSYNARGRLSPYVTRSPEGTSYICRTNGTFIALNRTGRELWRVKLEGPLAAPALVGWDGRIFVPTANRISCYTASGFPLWSKPLNAALALKPQLDKQGGVLALTANREILILSPYGKASAHKLSEAPAIILSLDAAAARLLAPAATKAAEEAVRAAAAEAARLAAEAKTSAARDREAAEKATANAAAASPTGAAKATAQDIAQKAEEVAHAAALAADEAAQTAEEAAAKRPPVFTGEEQTVLAIYKNGSAESIRWYNDGESAFAAGFSSLGAAPLAATSRGDTIGAALANGKAALFSVAEGRVLWSADSHIRPAEAAAETANAAGNVALIYDERGLYVLSKAGATAYGTDGKQLWTMRPQGPASLPAYSDDGILYAGGSDWVLYAYRMEDTAKPQKQSLYGPAAEGSYTQGGFRPSDTPNRYDVANRLALVAEAIQEGQVGEREGTYAAYLMEIAGSAAAAPPGQSRTHPLVHVNHRAEAARLLSYIGSRETVPFLAGLCRGDPDPLVKAAAVEAIGAIGVDPDGAAMAAFAALVFPLIPGRDERVMASVAAAAGSLCRFSGPPLSEAGARLLTAIANIGPSFAQAVARREIRSLRGE